MAKPNRSRFWYAPNIGGLTDQRPGISITRSKRAGLTLIEMMVSIALTLIVVLAVIRLFDMVGSTVTESRSILELSAQLRNVSNQLQQDLDRATVTMLPPIDPDSGGGFFELIEGPDSDWDPQFGIAFDEEAHLGRNIRNPQLPDAVSINGQLIPDPTLTNHYLDASGRYGDLDDILMFTIKSDGEPFVGRVGDWAVPLVGSNTIRSDYAVVVWWVEKHFGAAGAGLNPIAQSLKLHRRMFLIRPDLDQLLIASGVANRIDLSPSGSAELNRFLDQNDLAVYIPIETRLGLRASSLSDLSDRRKRYGHAPQIAAGLNYPYRTMVHPGDIVVTDMKRQHRDAPAYSMPTLYPLGLLSRDPGYNTLSNVEKHFYDRAGEDVMLSDIVAFDVKVYDPQAPLIASTDGSIVLAPHDIGYWNMPKNTPPIMRGAFVDLAYARYQMSNFFAGSHFAAAPENKSGLAFAIAQPDPTEPLYRTRASAIYDTWSTGYERDGMAQFSGGIDLGANGLDDNNNGIVDDVGERDTLPPYPHPLRGIEVSIRVVDPGGTQQIRQTSVVANFKHE